MKMASPTTRQIKRLYALAGRAGLTREDVHEQIGIAYSVKSSRDLTRRQYEEYCGHLLALAGVRPGGDGKSPEAHRSAYPLIWKKEHIDELLTQEWLNCPPALRPDLLIMLDDCRLYRKSRRIAQNKLAKAIQLIKINAGMADNPERGAAVLRAALDDWMEKHRVGKNENYFRGIVRNKKRDADAAQGNPPSLKLRRTGGSKVKGQSQPGRSTLNAQRSTPTDHERRQAAIAESREAEFQAMLTVLRSVAGCGTAVPAVCGCAGGEFFVDANGAIKSLPCPFCNRGINLLRFRLNHGLTRKDVLALPYEALKAKVGAA